MLNLIVQLTNSQAGKAVPMGALWMNDAQVLALKFYYHLASLHVLVRPVEVVMPQGATSHIDHGSVLVLARAALETFLTFAHVFGSAESDLRQFRHMTWRCAGLLDRQKLQASARRPENKQKLVNERASIETLRAEMQAHSRWVQHSEKEHGAFLKGDWRAGRGWAAIGVEAGFHPVLIRELYSYLCGYSHTSWLSILQIRDARELSQQAAMTAMSVSTVCVLMSFFALHYAALFPDAEHVLAAHPEATALIRRWNLHAKRVAGQYERE
ncbi:MULTISPECIES: hypothetical protein [Paraburkholderia]|uniref:Uncharacterized protein n=1 Tax=Paraburkholderia madseniana TaxID=2599607 RepID=A0AAP5ET11_9BURK|nr:MULTISPECIES: hypothetical protein [Paraburkholderia]MCX4151746.1 hypothetical protein [Paraburkholderia madseniana]MDN7154673.1 hypothetical protein [Paraburkholderia sp. WS6]MDQ6413556.1 hypothetical protein [Paraburkholderia madseniana]